MKKQIVVNFLKYAVALGLMAWVIANNWGDPRGTVGKIVVGDEPEKGKIAGKVLSFKPDDSIRIERFSSEGEGPDREAEFALKKPSSWSRLWMRVKKLFSASAEDTSVTAIVQADGTPWSAGQELQQGTVVTLSGISRGLAYVWQRHVHGGEPVHAGYLLLAFAVALPSMLLTFVRWYILVRAVELPFRAIDAFRLGFIGLFFNNFMPGSVGGDVIKAAALAREQDRRTVAVATVIMDRAIALWALVWFVALLGAGFWMSGLLVGQGAEQCRKIVAIAWTIVGLSVLVWTALGLLPERRAQRFAGRLERWPKIGATVAELWRAVWMYRCRPRAVGGVLLLSWVGHVGFVFLFYFAMRTLWQPDSGEQVPSLAQHFLIVPIGLVIQAAPFFPGGAGIGELGFGLLYQWLGCSEASGVLGSLVQRVINWTLGLLGGLTYLRMRTALKSALRREEVLMIAD
ncbi:MAG TPA: lysylphosphatidylglycerol synthase transmembrane domain-containing protein [Gemmataceae bacterium]|nr:lysylphosphatidylglycerol synthase transmembrane domain-containing protein [Gemmataceae bacterium]